LYFADIANKAVDEFGAKFSKLSGIGPVFEVPPLSSFIFFRRLDFLFLQWPHLATAKRGSLLRRN
jgi:hypothetical protein